MASRSGSEREATFSGDERQPDLLSALRRQWWIILGCGLLLAGAGYVYSSSKSVVYESRATVLLIAAGNEQSPGGGLGRSLDVETWATVARSTALMQLVADEVGMSLGTVKKNSTASAAPTGDVLVLTFSSTDADEAADGAAAYSKEFLAQRQVSVNASNVQLAQVLAAERDDLNEQIVQVNKEIDEEEAKGDAGSASRLRVLASTQELTISRLVELETVLTTLDTNAPTGRVIIDPQTTVQATGFGVPLTTATGFFLGLLIGSVLALLRDRHDDRYSSVASSVDLGLQELGRVPIDVTSAGPDSRTAYSRVLARLSFARSEHQTEGRTALLLPVESATLPAGSANVIASQLRRSGAETGLVIGLWTGESATPASDAYWGATTNNIRDLRAENDIVLVSTCALDESAVGLGLAALVDETVLLISPKTNVNMIQRAVDDLRDVKAASSKVLVVTGVRRRDRRRRAAPGSHDQGRSD